MNAQRIIIVDEVIPSGNMLTRLHWAARAKLITRWFYLVRANSRGLKWEKHKPAKFKVTVTRHAPGIQLDISNMVHAADKLILDNIKSLIRKRFPSCEGRYTFKNLIIDGLIYDDSPAYLDLKCRQVRSKKKIMEIVIKEV